MREGIEVRINFCKEIYAALRLIFNILISLVFYKFRVTYDLIT